MTQASQGTARGHGARIIADSLNRATGHRLTTWELKYWRAVHDELMTHKELSRNTASARAIPFTRMCDMIIDDPALPVEWGTNQAGMQPGAELPADKIELARNIVLDLRDHVLKEAMRLHELGLHKQVVNRYLQPWAYTTVIVSTTSHTNFLGLRCHHMAQADIRAVALLMRPLLAASVPVEREPGDWHLPFITDGERDEWGIPQAIKVCAGRCARISYLNHEGKYAPDEDVGLHDRLVAGLVARTDDPGHMSPLEHPAEAMDKVPSVEERLSVQALVERFTEDELRRMNDALVSSGNFRGWAQLRKRWAGEHIGGWRP